MRSRLSLARQRTVGLALSACSIAFPSVARRPSQRRLLSHGFQLATSAASFSGLAVFNASVALSPFSPLRGPTHRSRGRCAMKPRSAPELKRFGYFMGKLSRFRVCALYKPGVEIPSDYQGVLYIELDPAGAWKQKLAQELVEANFSIDLDGLLRA
jgi:hypothetical protein